MTKAYLCCAFMQWCGMKRLEDTQKGISIPTTEDTKECLEQFIKDAVGSFVKEYVLVEFDPQKKIQYHMEEIKRKIQRSN